MDTNMLNKGKKDEIIKIVYGKHLLSGKFNGYVRCRRGRDRMIVGFTTTGAISAYRH